MQHFKRGDLVEWDSMGNTKHVLSGRITIIGVVANPDHGASQRTFAFVDDGSGCTPRLVTADRLRTSYRMPLPLPTKVA